MNACPLISPERVNELFSYLPARDGRQWGNDEQHTAARVIYSLLKECGIYGNDIRGIGLTLTRFSQ
jgi:hypothetical protein